ncbi:MAG TPA: DNA-3-methyladenine glycosylase 2 family protein [Solirubrobacteraceae bacterium]|jgi:DNA-3-methyladenine glycosylase II|nr:DNA-3-methyladenine glycosylase 2 family protein [Solirubrobacteraceae bacterium]
MAPRKATAAKATPRKATSGKASAGKAPPGKTSPRKTSPSKRVTPPKAPTRKAPPRRRVSLAKATEHLRASDPILAKLIDEVGKLPNPRQGRPERNDHYGALVRAIVGQQLSVLAARAIYGRLTARFQDRPPTPQEIMADDPEELRAAAGLSRAKVGFLRSLAEHVLSGELELERLDELQDEDVIAELVAVKGIGEWSAHMFLMFHLERPDVVAPGDLGIRRAIERAYGFAALPQPAEIEQIAEPWRPHRTLACRYLWRSLQNEPD